MNQSASSKKHYEKNKVARIESAKKQKQRLKLWVREQKSKPCLDCNTVYPYYVMQFDHRPGTVKIDAISRLGKDGRVKIVQVEIDKCDLVCANCHAVRTFNRSKKAIE